jgi:exopolysaccharide biosynthesis protein
MRLSAFLMMLLLNGSFVFAQTDSVSFSKTKWDNARLAPGVHLKQTWFKGKSLFGSNQFISVIEVKPNRKNRICLAYEPAVKRVTSDFGKQNGAIAAINGTFFDVKKGGSVDFIRVKGKVINENRLEQNNTRARHQLAALVIKNGKLQIDEWNGDPDWERNLDGNDVMLTGPLLLHNNRSAKLDSSTFELARHPRSAIAITSNNKILFITVDGRNANSAGLSMYELRKVVQWLHCTDAINLDGGGSTTLWEVKDGVVNYPSDNAHWDHEGERKVANVVMVKR